MKNKKAASMMKLIIAITVLLVFVAVTLTASFYFWQQTIQNKALETSGHVEDSVSNNSQVLIDILHEDLQEAEANLKCDGRFVEGRCLEYKNSTE